MRNISVSQVHLVLMRINLKMDSEHLIYLKNVYIHIPFCKSKCKYCSFVSFPKLEQKENYLDALKKEIHQNYKNEILNTLYFGGGTPSLLTPQEFHDLINIFNIFFIKIDTKLFKINITNFKIIFADRDCFHIEYVQTIFSHNLTFRSFHDVFIIITSVIFPEVPPLY